MAKLLYSGTRKEICEKVYEAYKAGALSMQIPGHVAHFLGKDARVGPSAVYYTNTDAGQVFKCGVGQLLSDEDAAVIQAGEGGYLLAGALMQNGAIRITDMDEYPAELWLQSLQNAHDNGGGLFELLDILDEHIQLKPEHVKLRTAYLGV